MQPQAAVGVGTVVSAAARDHAHSNGLDIAYDVGVGEALPYQARAFDAVLSATSIFASLDTER